jgi:hypothetical protein
MEWLLLGFGRLGMAGMPLAIERWGISGTGISASMLGPLERKDRLGEGGPVDEMENEES